MEDRRIRWGRLSACLRRSSPALTAALLVIRLHGADTTASPDAVIQSAKQAERAAGIRPTKNFGHADPHVRAFYRCYYTGPLQLPDSYAGLKLRKGSPEGCPLNPQKYDVFFYPIEAVASGHTPVTESLAAAPTERVATVVPHEDFHEQIPDLPDEIGEAAATLAGFLTGAAALESTHDSALDHDAELFLEKSRLVNRYHERLSAVYQARHDGQLSRTAALDEKRKIFAAIQQECAAIQPDPRSFNKCVSSGNNAGLAFDHTYTKYYPLVYQVYLACRRDVKCAIDTMARAPRKTTETAVVQYFQAFVAAHSADSSVP